MMEHHSAGADSASASLARELNHRVRNMLQIVMGLCNQTLRQSEDLRQFEHLFLGRVQALARVYEVLQREGWTQVPVHELIESIVSRVLGAEHFDIGGEKVLLSADAATGFGLVVHEIVEGARQRGVGGQGGRLTVRWEVIGTEGDGASNLAMHWHERTFAGRDHAVSTAVYERLQRQIRHELNGSISLESASGSLDLKLNLPLARGLSH